MMWLGRIAQGGLTMLLSIAILCCIRTADPEHGLPERNSRLSAGISFVGGFLLFPADIWISALGVVFISCLGAMAYTDFYSGQVYPFFCYAVALPGYVYLIALQDWDVLFHVVVFAAFAISAGLLHAYSFGDAEMFLTAAPFLALLAEQSRVGVFLGLCLYWGASAFFGIAIWLFKRLGKKSCGEKFAMAPAMYLALLSALFFGNFT